jgi:tetratricopeptide (TPR) repeat protein
MKTVATKDAKAAGKLAEKIFRKLQSENLTTNISTLRFVTSFLDSEFKSRHTDVSPGEKLAAMTKPASILTDESLREWTDLLAGATPAMLEAAVTGKSRNVADAINGLSSILRLLPDLEKFSPALTQNLRKKYAEVSPKLEDPVREWIEIDIIQRNGKVADLLALAEKVSELQKPGIYSQAVWMALNIEADFETARKIVNEHIADPEQKKSQLRMIEWVYSQYCADQGKLEEAIAAADKLGSESERLRILADLVESPIKKGNRKLAMQMLERTLNLFPQEIESAGQLQAMARIIQHLAGLNAEQGFVMFEKNIEPLNQVVAARIIICRFEEYSQSWALRDEIMISSGYTYISPLLQYLEAVKSLARINLNRSIEIISRSRQPELRAYATLIATRAILLEP